MLKLRAMLEQPDDQAQALRVLRRLSTAPITGQLESTTGICALVRELSTDETVQAAMEAGSEEAAEAATVTKRIVSAWEAQLEEERREQEAHRQRNARPAAAQREKRKDPETAARVRARIVLIRVDKRLHTVPRMSVQKARAVRGALPPPPGGDYFFFYFLLFLQHCKNTALFHSRSYINDPHVERGHTVGHPALRDRHLRPVYLGIRRW